MNLKLMVCVSATIWTRYIPLGLLAKSISKVVSEVSFVKIVFPIASEILICFMFS